MRLRACCSARTYLRAAQVTLPSSKRIYTVPAVLKSKLEIFRRLAISNRLIRINRSGFSCCSRKDRLLFVSSSEVYGNRERFSYDAGGEIAEDEYGYVDILSSRSCYPSGKRAAESLCASYIDEYDVDAVIVRPGYIYGPTISKTDSRASAAFTLDAAAGRDIIMKSKGEQLRSYCYMLDCASALLSVLLNGERGEAYNISNKDSIVTIRDVAECLARKSGVNVVFEIPSDEEKKSFNPMKNSVLDASKLESLGWKACFGLEEGIERTLKFL